jgi:hypothetical protein
MMAERHHGPLSYVHANPAGNARNCASAYIAAFLGGD